MVTGEFTLPGITAAIIHKIQGIEKHITSNARASWDMIQWYLHSMLGHTSNDMFKCSHAA